MVIEADKFPKLHENEYVLLRRLRSYTSFVFYLKILKLKFYFLLLVQGSKNSLEFNDYLKTYSLTGEEIGDFTITVKQTIYKNYDCFHVEAKR